MSPDDIIIELSVRIYEPPLTEYCDSGQIADLTNPLSVVMLILYFDTELQMNGVVDFIGNSTGIYAAETVAALRLIGCEEMAEALNRILFVAETAGMTHSAIQEDRSTLEPFTVTTATRTHGDKWSEAAETIHELADQMSFDPMYQQLEHFVARHFDVLEPLAQARS
jgi:hypothetical protein